MADVFHMTQEHAIDCGATYQCTVTWTDSNGNPINLTGYTARMKFKNKHGGTTLASLTDSSGLTLGGALGTIAIAIPDETTATMSGSGVYDLELESAGGVVTRVLEGSWEAKPEVTD